MSRRTATAEPAPHSWDLEYWPLEVWPHTPGRARYVLRAHRAELIAAGAISRVGRELIVLGARYTRWLESRTTAVPDYDIAPNIHRDEQQPSAAV
jgi:hypothetical protein